MKALTIIQPSIQRYLSAKQTLRIIERVKARESPR